jgi:hypothetical protein
MKQALKKALTFLFLLGLVPFQMAKANLVPKNLHFIWIGEDVPEEYSENIKTWISRNPDYKLVLWSDKQMKFERTLAKNDRGYFKYEYGDIEALKKEMNQKFPRLVSFLERESHGKFPNYAAASDILRLMILHKLGGVYIDTDEIPTDYYHGCGTQYYEQFNPKFREIYFKYLSTGNSPERANVLAIQEYEKTGPHPTARLGDIIAKCGMRWSQRLRGPTHTSHCNDLVAGLPGASAEEFALRKIEANYREAESSKPHQDPDNLIWVTKRLPREFGDRSKRLDTMEMSGPGLYEDQILPYLQEAYAAEIGELVQSLKPPYPEELQRALSPEDLEKPYSAEEKAQMAKHIGSFCLTRFPFNGIIHRALTEKWYGPTPDYKADEKRELIKKAKRSFAAEAPF